MTIFGRRTPTNNPRSASTPWSAHATTPRVEENVFEHIVFPEDQTDDVADMAQCNEYRRHSDDSSDIHSSHWDSKSGSEPYTTPSATSGESYSNENVTEAAPKSRGGSSGCRFSKEARSVLRTWYHEHRENPYPTSEEKDQLVLQTGLKRSQIALWLANTRRKDRARANERQKQSLAPAGKTFAEMTPFDRWKVTPIDLEAVAPPVIMAACEDNPLQPMDPIEEDVYHEASYPRSLFSGNESTANFSAYDAFFAQSMVSYDTNITSLLGAESISDGTNFSFNPIYGTSMPKPNRDRRRRRVNTSKPPKPTKNVKERPFHCTFCPSASFATKHDWQRHEKSQHLSLETWVCSASGGTILSPSGTPLCAFCDTPNPNKAHLETHNFSACQVKEPAERTFYRKDHFMQHLRLTHECKINPRMESWKSEIVDVKSRCGFCDARFETWSQRAEHLASHFKCRATMAEWRGGWGFEPHIAALVERAGNEPLLVEPAMSETFMPTQSQVQMQIPKAVYDPSQGMQMHTNLPPVPLFSAAEMDELAAATDPMMMGFDPSAGSQGSGVNVVGEMPLVGYDGQDLMALGASDVVDWAQFTT